MDDRRVPPPAPHSRRGRSAAPLSNDRLIDGKYELHGVLGEGGTGIVYDAIRKSDGAPVALKVIHAHLAGDRQIRGRFQREATILKRLEGAHICPILELGEVPATDGASESLLYMALPKLEGPTLEHVLEKEGPIAVERALEVMLEVCAALRVAHAHGVIHRDLKPANVILESGKKAVVVDFGMAKIVTGSAGGTTNLTAHNMVFGTPEYMSPEQARGDELDARCDVYAAGVMLYEMLAGSPPFSGSTPLNVLTQHLSGVLEPPSSRAKDGGRVTPALESVVMHALARNRDERYPSASALAAAIMHARARPDDVAALSPGAFATAPAGTDVFAVTMPAVSVPAPRAISSPPVAGADIHTTGDTLLASGPPAALSAKPSSAPARAPSSRPRSSSSSSSKSPSKNPSSAPGSIPSVRPIIEESATGTWIVLWLLAGLVSIGIGVYFALR